MSKVGMVNEGEAKVSSKSKKFKPMKPSRKPFGFGKRIKQGMKGVPVGYGSA